MSDFITACNLLKEQGGYIRRPCYWYMFGFDNKNRTWQYGFADCGRGLQCHIISDGKIANLAPKDEPFNLFHISLDDYTKNDWEHVAPRMTINE